ncbi:glycosyltransferase family 2 protein [Alkalilacustris brevis]|uniref:glycosyltransferase family 2 protein n=1 Tax=Alkalilacustris brevis TaxID=2026338 RepID=UPI000E0DA4D2|nr:glycosyltransferase family 2 protein [Alkalilacustris brevis]
MDELDFSIVIPTHNRPKMLVEAVESALAECREGGEVIVVDDASERPARDILRPLRDPRLRVVENPGPHGAAGARNHGVLHAKGRIIFFLDDDDRFMEGYARRVLDRPEQGCTGDYGFAAAKVIWPGGHSEVLSHRMPTGLVAERAALRRRIASTGMGFWVRRKAFVEIGGFDTMQQVDEDTDLCVRLAARGHQVWYDADPGTLVTWGHGGPEGEASQLTTATPSKLAANCYLRTYEKSEGDLPAFSEARWWLATRYIRRAAKAGDIRRAQKFATGQRPVPFKLALLGYWAFRTLRKGLTSDPHRAKIS